MIHLLIGIPGSGKSTFSKELKQEYNCDVVSTDELRNQHPDFDEPKIWELAYSLCREAIKNNKDIIFDATNVTPRVRKRFVDEVSKYGDSFEMTGYYFDTPWQECYERVKIRNTIPGERFLPLEVIESYGSKIIKPTLVEGFKKIKFIKNGKIVDEVTLNHHEIDINDLSIDPFLDLKNWAVLTSGNKESYNSMVIAWGGFGILWRKNVAFAFVRENRYTFEFIEKYDEFTISFYDKSYLEQLKVYGTKSGRDTNKEELTKFDAINIDGAISYNQADLIIVCKKVYQAKLDPSNYIGSAAIDFYKTNDDGTRHHMYIGEIIKILKKN